MACLYSKLLSQAVPEIEELCFFLCLLSLPKSLMQWLLGGVVAGDEINDKFKHLK